MARSILLDDQPDPDIDRESREGRNLLGEQRTDDWREGTYDVPNLLADTEER